MEISGRIQAASIVFICLICFGLGNVWIIVPSISHLVVTETGGFLTSREYASLAFYLSAGAILASQTAAEVGRFYGVKFALLGGVIAILLAAVFLGFIPFMGGYFVGMRYMVFIFCQFLLGLGVGSILTSVSAFFTLFMFKRLATLITGAFGCINLGSSSAPFFISLAHDKWSYFTLPLSVFLLLIIIATSIWLPNIQNPSELSREPLKVILKKLPAFFWLFVLAIIFFAICEDSLITWTPILFNKEKGISHEHSTAALAIFWFVVMITQFSVCALVNKIPARSIYRILPILLTIGFFGIVFAHGLGSSYFFFCVAAMGVSAFFALTMNFAEVNFNQVAEFVSGSLILGYLIGNVTSALSVGFLHQNIQLKLSTIFMIVGIIAAILFPITIRLSRKTSVISA